MWRYEIKYILEPHQWLQIEQMLIEHPASFTTLFPDRLINNIYYDTPDFGMCRDNLSGIAQRNKVRLRWYGDGSTIVNPTLEKKIKNNSLGRKENTPLNMTDYDEINNWINRHYLSMGYLLPVLKNQYLRSYYQNMEGSFRLTIDRNVNYQVADKLSFYNQLSKIQDDPIILELKFDQKDLYKETEITNFIPFRSTKHSKYVTGILACFP